MCEVEGDGGALLREQGHPGGRNGRGTLWGLALSLSWQVNLPAWPGEPPALLSFVGEGEDRCVVPRGLWVWRRLEPTADAVG